MIDLAWPIVALTFLLLAFVLAWRYLDGRVRYRDLAAEHHEAVAQMIERQNVERVAAVRDLDALEKRVRQLELAFENHQAAHQGM